MYIEFETWLTKGDLIYRIMDSEIETWKVTKVEVTTTDILNKETNHYINYWITPINSKYGTDMCMCQTSLKEKFYRDKKDLIQKIVSQL